MKVTIAPVPATTTFGQLLVGAKFCVFFPERGNNTPPTIFMKIKPVYEKDRPELAGYEAVCLNDGLLCTISGPEYLVYPMVVEEIKVHLGTV